MDGSAGDGYAAAQNAARPAEGEAGRGLLAGLLADECAADGKKLLHLVRRHDQRDHGLLRGSSADTSNFCKEIYDQMRLKPRC